MEKGEILTAARGRTGNIVSGLVAARELKRKVKADRQRVKQEQKEAHTELYHHISELFNNPHLVTPGKKGNFVQVPVRDENQEPSGWLMVEAEGSYAKGDPPTYRIYTLNGDMEVEPVAGKDMVVVCAQEHANEAYREMFSTDYLDWFRNPAVNLGVLETDSARELIQKLTI